LAKVIGDKGDCERRETSANRASIAAFVAALLFL
jgi:hypothetical protein